MPVPGRLVSGRGAVTCDKHIVSPLTDPWPLPNIHTDTHNSCAQWTIPLSLFAASIPFSKPAIPLNTVNDTEQLIGYQ